MAALTHDEQQTRITAALLTLVVAGVIFVALLIRLGGGGLPAGTGDEMGMEVNLGYDKVGYGDVQPDEPVGNNKTPLLAEEETPPQAPQTTPAPAPEEPAATKAVEPDPVATSDEESPVEVNEKKKKEVKPVEKAPEKPKEKPAPEQPKEVKKEPVKEEPKEVKKEPAPVVDKNATWKPGGSPTGKTTGDVTGKEGKAGNQGDDPGTVGDKGDPKGTPDTNGQYGKAGGGGTGGSGGAGSGPALDLYGWEWDEIPKPSIGNNETGRIVFEIEVDDNGELRGYKKISGGLSAGAERACVAALQKLTFSKKSGAKVPPISKGKITFVVRSE